MKVKITGIMMIALGMVFISQAVAQTGSGTGQPPTMPLPDRPPMKSESQPMTLPRTSEIIGLTVTNDQNQDLGKVKDLILDSDGRVTYLVIARGGFFGVGERLCAVPWQASKPELHERALVVTISKEQFESAPDFGSWAEFSSEDYKGKVQAYYGVDAPK